MYYKRNQKCKFSDACFNVEEWFKFWVGEQQVKKDTMAEEDIDDPVLDLGLLEEAPAWKLSSRFMVRLEIQVFKLGFRAYSIF